MQEHDRSRLFLFLLGVAAVHALCLAAILPALISLPGHGAGVTQGGIVKEDALVKDAIVDVEVFPSASTLPAPGSHASAYDVAPSHAAIEPVTPASEPSPAVSFSPTPDPSDLTSALPDIPQNADTAPGDPVTADPAAPLAAATPLAADLIGNASPSSSPPVPVEGLGSVSVADPASTNALPSEEANPATVALPVEKPALKKPSVKPRTTAAKTARPRARRQASVAKPQTQRLFGGFFQSQPRQKAQRVTPRQ
ncbi:MAG TPA: hypothetical protein VIG52_10985 [Methyloceanibacter sp.]